MKDARPKLNLPIATAALCLAGLSACTIVVPLPPLEPAHAGPRTPTPPNDSVRKVDFVRHIKPIFESRCLRCHDSESPQAGLNLQNPSSVFEATQMIVPGRAEFSRLYRAVSRPGGHPESVEDDGWWLSTRHRRLLRDWINEGAYWPRGMAGQLQE